MKLQGLYDKFNKHRSVSAAHLASFVLIALGWGWAYFALRGTDQPLILHFNNLIGINQVGGLSDLAPLGLFALILTVLSLFLSLELEDRDWFLGKLLTATTFGFGVLIFIGFAAIISVN